MESMKFKRNQKPQTAPPPLEEQPCSFRPTTRRESSKDSYYNRKVSNVKGENIFSNGKGLSNLSSPNTKQIDHYEMKKLPLQEITPNGK